MVVPAATISEPFLLSSYSSTRHTPKKSAKSKPRRTHPGVYASYRRHSASSDGFVTAAAQADGVHVLDVATLHPIVSRTLGPSTTFACPPLTQYQRSKNVHSTYAVIESSPDIESENLERTIWKWTEDLSASLTENVSSSKKQHASTVVSHPILGLYDCDALPDRIFAISANGTVSVLTTDLQLKTTFLASEGDSVDLQQAFVFPQDLCTFVPKPSSSTGGAVFVLIVCCKNLTKVQVLSLDNQDSVSIVSTIVVPLSPQEIVASSCNPSGFLNVICQSGIWHTYLLCLGSTDVPIAICSPIQLTGLSFIDKSSHRTSHKQLYKISNISLLALTSSHVLLTSLTTQNEVALLVWDTQYSVLLASHLFPLPSSLSSHPTSLTFQLVSPTLTGFKDGSQQALLVISEPIYPLTDIKSSAKSSIYVIPYSAPSRSTIANAIGHANTSTKWLSQPPMTGHDSSKKGQPNGQVEEPNLETPKAKLIIGMRTAMNQNRPQVVNALFSEWEKKEQEKATSESGRAIEFEFGFVKGILEALIQPEKPPNPLYSSEVVQHLIERGVVRSMMLESGLLAALRLRSDWRSIELALRHVPDISENEVVETLSAIAMQSATKPSLKTATDPNAMQEDPISDITTSPPLPNFLVLVLKHEKFTSVQLVSALRQHLYHPEVITDVLQILDGWIRKIQTQEAKLLPSKKDIVKNEHGVFVVKSEFGLPKSQPDCDLPSMDQILAFLQSLLDASFLTLLQHPPAYSVLRNLKAHIEPEIAKLSQTEQLRGLVEGFARAQIKTVRDAEIGGRGPSTNSSSSKAGGEDKRDWRQRRKEAHERAAMAVGVYQLEELVI